MTGDPDRTVSFAEPVVGTEEVAGVSEALESGWMTTGPKTATFEDELAEYVGTSAAVGTTNCTSALYLGLRSLDIAGKVITTPLTFASTVSSVLMAGGTPVLADVDPETLTLDPDRVQEQIDDDVEAILPVHYAGQGADLDAILDIAEDNDLHVVEDAAHAIGGEYEGNQLGTIGDVGCYSFYATKNITTGEGGMLVTDDERVAEEAGKLRLAGVNKQAAERDATNEWSYDVESISGKYNMNDLQASIGLAQLEKLDQFIETRRYLAERFDDRLAEVRGIRPLGVRDKAEHARHLYPVFVEEAAELSRDDLVDALAAEGIQTSVHYIPIHYHSAFRDVSHGPLDRAESAFEKLLCLPLHPNMSRADIDYVVNVLREVL